MTFVFISLLIFCVYQFCFFMMCLGSRCKKSFRWSSSRFLFSIRSCLGGVWTRFVAGLDLLWKFFRRCLENENSFNNNRWCKDKIVQWHKYSFLGELDKTQWIVPWLSTNHHSSFLSCAISTVSSPVQITAPWGEKRASEYGHAGLACWATSLLSCLVICMVHA